MSEIRHIIVTGGAGFIGSHVAIRLLKEGWKVTILDNLSTGKEENIPRGADFIRVDLGSDKDVTKWKKLSCDTVFHLAGQSSGEASFRDPLYDLRSHVMSTFFLLNWCKQKNIKRFLYASSMSVYGDPQSLPVSEGHPVYPKTFYGAGKACAEMYLKLNQTLGINSTIFRLFSVYGPGQNLENKLQGMVSIFLSYMLENKPILVKGSSERFRDFVFVDDVVDAWIMSLDNPVSYGKTYNVGGGRRTTIKQLLDSLKGAFGKSDYPIEFSGTTPGDQFGVEADISLILRDLGWSPKMDLDNGLAKMVIYEKGRMSHE